MKEWQIDERMANWQNHDKLTKYWQKVKKKDKLTKENDKLTKPWQTEKKTDKLTK